MQAAAKTVSQKFEHVHLLLNVAGILHVPGKLSPGALPSSHHHLISFQLLR